MDRVQAFRQFQALNQDRFRRLIELAPAQHHQVFELLPLIFHLNHKSLPGYIDEDCPLGIVDYRPAEASLDRVKQFDRHFKHRQRALRKYAIRGLYLINPHGQLHYPDLANFELWLCYSHDINQTAIDALTAKAEAICEWAQAEGVTLTLQCWSDSDIASGILTAWQRESLYATGLVLAGSYPYWWLTSPDEDADYKTIVDGFKIERQFKQHSLIDFGATLPCDAASLFQLASMAVRRSYDDPEHLFDLLVYRQMLDEPQSINLAQRLKTHVYDQALLSFTEFNTLKWQCLKIHDRLAQQAFYRLFREPMSKTVKQARFPWRREILKEWVTDWQWSELFIKQQDDVMLSYNSANDLFQSVGKIISEIMRALLQLNMDAQLGQQNVLSVLGRHYRSYFQSENIHIPTLPPAYRPEPNNDKLFLTRFEDDDDWRLSQLALESSSQQALFKHPSLVHVMAYAMRNHILTRSNMLSVNDEQQYVSTTHAVELATQLTRAITSDNEITPLNAPSNSDTIAGLELYINLEQQPDTILSKQGLNLSSNLNDPLNYSSYKQSLVLTIDGIIRLHDGQWQSIQFSGEDVVPSLLKQILLWRPQSTFDIQCWCPTPIFGHAISERLRTLINSTAAHYLRFPERGRLLMNVAERAYTLQWHGNVVEHIRRPPQQEIWRTLANLHHAFTATYIDRYLDKDQLFNTLLSHQTPDRVNVFFYAEAQTIICYVLDEFGNLVKQQFQKMSERTLLAHLQQFLGEIQQQHGLQNLQFFRLTHPQNAWHLTPLSPPSVPEGYLPIKVMMSQFSPQAQCTVMCGDKWYEGQANDVALFQKVRNYVLSLRSGKQTYPIYLNSLRFSDNKHYPAAFYVQQKQRLERLFDPAS